MKLIGLVAALHWAVICFVPVTAQDISSIGSLLSNMQQYASLASQILSLAQPFLGASNAINQDVAGGSLTPSNGFSSLLTSSNSYPQSGSDGLLGGVGASATRQSGFGGLLGQFLGGGGGGGNSGGGAFSDFLAPKPTRTPKSRARGTSLRKEDAERIRQGEFESLLASFVGSGVPPARPQPGDRGLLSEFFGRRKKRSSLLN